MCKKLNNLFSLTTVSFLSLSIVMFVLLFSGCSFIPNDNDYNNNSKISNSEDNFQAQSWSGNDVSNGFSINGSGFSGNRTIWEKNLEKDEEVEFNIKLSLAQGKAKIVYIDKDNYITTLHEVDSNNNDDQNLTCKQILKKGNNRIKFVGSNCTDFNFELTSDYFLQNNTNMKSWDIFPDGLFHENSKHWPLNQ